MGNTMKTFLKSASSSGHKSKSDPNMMQAQIAQMRFNTESTLPKEDDLLANLFSDTKDTLGQNPKGWRALASGVMSGLEYGAKKKSLLERKEDLAKYNRVMDYLEEANYHAGKRLEWYQKRDMAKTQIMPSVYSYVDNMQSLDPQSRQLMAQSILDNWNKTTGDSYKFLAIDAVNPLQMAVTDNSGKILPINIMDLAASDETMQQRIAMRMPEFLQMQQMERHKLANEDKGLALREQELLAREDYRARHLAQVDQRIDLQDRGIGLKEEKLHSDNPHLLQEQINEKKYTTNKGVYTPFRLINEKMRKKAIDDASAAYKKIPLLDIAVDNAKEMKQILIDHPDLSTAAWTNMIGKDKEGESMFKKILANTLLNDKKRTAIDKLHKLSSELALRKLEAMQLGGRMSVFLQKMDKDTIPKIGMTTGSSVHILNNLIDVMEKQKENASLSYDAITHNRLFTPKDYIPEKTAVKDPETGQLFNIPTSSLDKALAKGGVVANETEVSDNNRDILMKDPKKGTIYIVNPSQKQGMIDKGAVVVNNEGEDLDSYDRMLNITQ